MELAVGQEKKAKSNALRYAQEQQKSRCTETDFKSSPPR